MIFAALMDTEADVAITWFDQSLWKKIVELDQLFKQTLAGSIL